MFVSGIDGCKSGWFAVSIYPDDRFEFDVYATLSDAWDNLNSASLILIDVPIGLKEDGADERLCDKFARNILGQPRSSSVFRVPCRPAVFEEEYEQSSQKNYEMTSTRISPYTWGIVPKIREVDEFLNNNIMARKVIRESHPELCFWSFNGDSMLYKKKESGGIGVAERKSILNDVYPLSNEIFLKARRFSKVQDDDILDAISLAVNADKNKKNLISIPGDTIKDNQGLPMEMVFQYHENIHQKKVTYNSLVE